MSTNQNKVIVAGCDHAGLATIRALGKHGLHVIAISDVNEFGMASRYVSEKAVCPHPKDMQAFADFMLARAADWSGALLLETNDFFATAISAHKAELSEHYHVITPNWEHVQLFIEKDHTYQLADKCNVPHPGIYNIATMQELDQLADALVFPVMIKPVKSHEFFARFKTKLFVVEDLEALRERFQATIDLNLPVMIQEIIPGTDEGTLERIEIYINSQGEIGCEQYNIKLRQTPPMYGMMRVGKSTPPISDIRQYALDMLREIGFKGFASFEFKRDQRDGLAKLIEINIRLIRYTQLIIASGVDLPWIIYQDIIHHQHEPVPTYEEVYYVDIIPDIGNTLFRDTRLLFHLPRLLLPYLSRNKTFAVLALSDFKPFLKFLTSKWGKFWRLVTHQVSD